MRGMRKDESAAWNGLHNGSLDKLADLLEQGDGQLHPILQRKIVELIRGSVNETDYRMMIGRHPDLKRASFGQMAKRRGRSRELAIALAMYRHGALTNAEAACAAVAAETGLGRATIMRAWGKGDKRYKLNPASKVTGKSYTRFLLAHGLLPK